jgi:hypothetical protein
MKRDCPALLQPPDALSRDVCATTPAASGKWVSAPGKQLPVVSLVTCSFQQARYLERAIRSVLDQQYPCLQYIVIDRGSTDGSVEMIRRYAPALAYWESARDCGPTDALVKGLKHATGEIHGWLCSDDLLLPGALAAVGEFFNARPEAMAVYGRALWIDAEGRFLRAGKEAAFDRLVLRHDQQHVPQPAMFWRRALYHTVNGLDPRFELAADADLWARFSAAARIEHMPRYLSCKRWYGYEPARSRQSRASVEVELAFRSRACPAGRQALRGRLIGIVARCMRVAAAARADEYRARTPAMHRAWLERHPAAKTPA